MFGCLSIFALLGRRNGASFFHFLWISDHDRRDNHSECFTICGNVHWCQVKSFNKLISSVHRLSKPCIRFLIGFGLTFAAAAAPLLVTEIAYPSHRAQATAMYNTLWCEQWFTAKIAFTNTDGPCSLGISGVSCTRNEKLEPPIAYSLTSSSQRCMVHLRDFPHSKLLVVENPFRPTSSERFVFIPRRGR